MPKTRKHICVYNIGVDCYEHNIYPELCSKCGFNPSVEEERKEKNKKEIVKNGEQK